MIWVERIIWVFAIGITLGSITRLVGDEMVVGLLGLIVGILLSGAAFGLGVMRGAYLENE